MALAQMTDIEILTKIAQQIAMRKENGAGAVLSHQGFFFTKMGMPAGHSGQFTRAAKTPFAGCAIDPALTGAKGAFRHSRHGLLSFGPQARTAVG